MTEAACGRDGRDLLSVFMKSTISMMHEPTRLSEVGEKRGMILEKKSSEMSWEMGGSERERRVLMSLRIASLTCVWTLCILSSMGPIPRPLETQNLMCSTLFRAAKLSNSSVKGRHTSVEAALDVEEGVRGRVRSGMSLRKKGPRKAEAEVWGSARREGREGGEES